MQIRSLLLHRQQLALLVCAFLFSFVSIRWVKSGYDFRVQTPNFELKAIPLTFSGWEGRDIPIPEETAVVLKADSHINRTYRDMIGREVSLHAAIWATPKEVGEAAPHHPDLCYTVAGWEIMDRKLITIDTSQGEVPLELIHFQKLDASLVTAHWYRMGDQVFTSADEGRAAFYDFWGHDIWPYTEKFLLQTEQLSIAAAEPLLRRIATDLNGVLIDLQPQAESTAR